MTRPAPADAGLTRVAPERLRTVLLTASVLVLVVVGLSGPHVGAPRLGPLGGLPEPLLGWSPTPAVEVALVWGAYLLGAASVALGLGRAPRPCVRQPKGGFRTARMPSARLLLLAALSTAMLLATPFGSGDHLNYAAYGRILSQGGDPWVESPIAWHGGGDPIAGAVEEPWTTEPSVYGPFGTLLFGLAARVGGENLRLVVCAWQVLVVAAWLGAAALLRSLVTDRARVDLLWTFNPLVLGPGVLGAHVDMVAAVLMIAAWWCAARHPGSWVGWVGAGGLAALAGSVKFPFAVVLVVVLWVWWRAGRRMPSLVAAGVFALVAVGLHVWAGPHVFDQLARARQSVSLATVWRPLVEVGVPRPLITVGAAVLAVVVAWAIWRLFTDAAGASGAEGADRAGAVLLVALAAGYVLSAPYSLPWYDLLVWVALPLVVAGGASGATRDTPGRHPLPPRKVFGGIGNFLCRRTPTCLSRGSCILLGRLLVMACAYVPGRVVPLPQSVEAVTMGFRRSVAPWLNIALVAALVTLAVARQRRDDAR